MKNLLIGLLLFPVLVASGAGPERQVHKTIGQTELGIDIYKPEGWAATDQRPAIVFYHGGGWKGGKPDQFAEQATEPPRPGQSPRRPRNVESTPARS